MGILKGEELLKMPTKEILAIIRHEIGHWKLGHVPLRLASIAAFFASALQVLGAVVDSPAIFEAFGYKHDTKFSVAVGLGIVLDSMGQLPLLFVWNFLNH